MKPKHCILFLILFALSSCLPQKADDATYEIFNLPCNRDTTFLNKDGVEILIDAKSILCQEGEIVQLKVQSILSKIDMIRNEFFTIDENGGILESGGMINLEVLSGGKINPELPIEILIPAKYIKNEMSIYALGTTNGQNRWQNTGEQVLGTQGERIEEGKQLFQENCNVCHSNDLRKTLTGPALGNVHLFRDLEWLIRFTKNSSAMIAQRDSIANCLWISWQPTIMNSFENLSENEISSIYQYIANESKIQNILKDEIKYPTNCPPPSLSTFSQDSTAGTIDMHYDPIDTVYQYLLELKSSGWFNVDYFLSHPDSIAPIILQIPKNQRADLSVSLAFRNRNIVIPFEKQINQYGLLNSFGKEKINFPKNELVDIIAYRVDKKTKAIIEYEIKSFRTQEKDNTIRLELEPLGEKDFYALIPK